MKKLYPIFTVILLLIFSLQTIGQKNKSNDLLLEIAAEVSQDSLTNYILSLQNIGTRYAMADNTKEVALWIKGKFDSFGYENVMLDSFLLDHNGMQVMQYNVICRSDSIYSHKDYVLLGAHHDAITYTTPVDSTPGADDNASGVAGVLECARVLKMHGQNSKKPFHFATWGAEELGLHGSINYVTKYMQMDSLPVFYINLDMIANSTDGNRKIDYSVSEGLGQLIEVAANTSEIIPVNSSYSGGSDHVPFRAADVPILYFAENNFSEYYHSDNDRLENLEMDFATEVVKGTAAAMYYGAKALPLTQIIEVLNAGEGDDLIVTWEKQSEAVLYKIDIYHDGNLIRSLESVNDSLYIDDLPFGQPICIELYGVDVDSLAGLHSRSCIELSNIPEQLTVSSEMNLDEINISWSKTLPLDADNVIVERKRKDEESFQQYDVIAANSGHIQISNHESGFWDYQLSLTDSDGLESEPTNAYIFSTQTKNDVLVISGQLGGYDNPTTDDVIGFYEEIMPLKSHYFLNSSTESKYLPILQNMEVVIWNTFSATRPRFYLYTDLIRTYVENGGKLILFAKDLPKHFDPNYSEGDLFQPESWLYKLGVTSMLENNGARLKQLLHSSGLAADVDPEKLPESFNGSLPNIDAFVPNMNSSVVLTYQSL
ncbi:MAG: M28 family metallopeptidase, partial [Salinivirgaceae bacterium]|nr:M28 family metallopeptidase [Salinivirgaceae bacterium]